MARKKATATTTLNPLHFEDLEPHRFEDLVRRLLYHFRDWSDIEPTGRAGSDEGFDVRAWERQDTLTNVGDEGEEGAHAAEGRLWQVQGKREKAIPPAKMKALIREGVDEKNPPYGYILAAATNISKTTYDTLRTELRKKGVRESYFWGKDHLEDTLSQPQNDEILFTFFGISLSPRRRARAAEIKFEINNKNKILRLAFGGDIAHDGVVDRGVRFLLRDIKDTHYPKKERYSDFAKMRRWEEHDAIQVTAKGVLFKAREWYAYCDAKKKEWDFTKAVDLTPRVHNLDAANEARLEDAGKAVERYWRHLPRQVQAKLKLYGFVSFEDMLIIDDKGDPEYAYPHIFIDFGEKGPFQYLFANLIQNNQAMHENTFTKFKKRPIFPTKFPSGPKGKIHALADLGLTGGLSKWSRTLYSFDGKLDFLREGDLIRIPKTGDGDSDEHLEVTHAYQTTVGAEVKSSGSDHYKGTMKEFAGRDIRDTDKVTVYEVCRVMPFSGGGSLIYLDDTMR